MVHSSVRYLWMISIGWVAVAGCVATLAWPRRRQWLVLFDSLTLFPFVVWMKLGMTARYALIISDKPESSVLQSIKTGIESPAQKLMNEESLELVGWETSSSRFRCQVVNGSIKRNEGICYCGQRSHFYGVTRAFVRTIRLVFDFKFIIQWGKESEYSLTDPSNQTGPVVLKQLAVSTS